MERFVVSRKATLLALTVFVILAWVIGRPFGQVVYHGVTEHVCDRTVEGYDTNCRTQLRWVGKQAVTVQSPPLTTTE
jgi:hypothetical protein